MPDIWDDHFGLAVATGAAIVVGEVRITSQPFNMWTRCCGDYELCCFLVCDGLTTVFYFFYSIVRWAKRWCGPPLARQVHKLYQE